MRSRFWMHFTEEPIELANGSDMGSERERKQVRLISVGFALAAPFSGRGEV
jgi:hypothetical protein